MKKKIIPQEISVKDLHQYIIGAVAPRPIAFVSTRNKKGKDNLAPYSFFNAFSSNPPIVVFSSNRRVSDNTTKHTLDNVSEGAGLTISVVNHAIVRQMALTSVEFPDGVSEYSKSGLTPIAASQVSASMVEESPINMECVVKDIITLGQHGGAGHLIICEVVCMHIEESVLTDKGRIDPHKIDLMGRLGRTHYVRASGSAIMDIYQGVVSPVLGYDNLPPSLLRSKILTGNEIASLAALEEFPDEEMVNKVGGKNLTDSEKDDQAKLWIGAERYAEALALYL